MKKRKRRKLRFISRLYTFFTCDALCGLKAVMPVHKAHVIIWYVVIGKSLYLSNWFNSIKILLVL